MMDHPWLDLRAGGRLWGRLHRESLVIEFGASDWLFVFDIVSSAREGRPIVTRQPRPQKPAKPERIYRTG